MKDLEKIYISPVNFRDDELFESLSSELSKRFGFPCRMLPLEENLSFALDPERGQYHSSKISRRLSAKIPKDALRILIVVNVDLYVPRLRFVFGEAQIGGPSAIISVTRLRQEFYGMKPDRGLFRERTVKEAVHELGHTFGLSHCRNSSCVMFFSNSLPDTDRKKSDFCPECRRRLLSGIDQI